MPRLVSRQRGALTAVDLGHYACRLEIGATSWAGAPCFSLVYRYAPPQSAVGTVRPDLPLIDVQGMSVMALARARVELAPDVGSVERIAAVALAGGSLDDDVKRTREAFEMFKNLPRVRGETLAACTEDACKLVGLYWQISDWLWSGAQELKQVDLEGLVSLRMVP